jgi:hypothetical protein
MIQADRIIELIIRLVKNGRNELTSLEIHTKLGLAPNKFPNVCAAMRNVAALSAGGVELVETSGLIGDAYNAKYKVIPSR